jgi:hypothetical protein
MSGMQLLLSFAMVTIGWQLVARIVGPILAKKLYLNQVAAVTTSGRSFGNEAAQRAWAEQASARAVNMSLLLLAAGCGIVAGLMNFPLIGFSRSFNGWSWLRVLTLCGTSWIVALALHPLG